MQLILSSDTFFRSLELCNVKFRKLMGKDARAETMERDIDRVSR
jgi:DNA repair protein RAD50